MRLCDNRGNKLFLKAGKVDECWYWKYRDVFVWLLFLKRLNSGGNYTHHMLLRLKSLYSALKVYLPARHGSPKQQQLSLYTLVSGRFVQRTRMFFEVYTKLVYKIQTRVISAPLCPVPLSSTVRWTCPPSSKHTGERREPSILRRETSLNTGDRAGRASTPDIYALVTKSDFC